MTIPRNRVLLAIAAAIVLAAGCASLEPNPNLQKAQADVQAAANNPEVMAKAPHELRRAQEALANAERAWREKEPVEEVNSQAYVAQVRANAAMDYARARRATDEMQQAQAEVARLQLAAREREASLATAEARRQQRSAEEARADAARANRDAAAAAREAAAAADQAAAERARSAQAEQQAREAMAAAADQTAAERARTAQAQQQAREASERLALMEKRLVEIEGKQTDRGILVTLGDVLFEFGHAELLPAAEPRLDRLAEFLKQFPDRKLLIEGYTDAIGSESYNRDLSRRRAQAVQAALLRRGLDPSRMTTEGYGKAYPVADNASATGRQMNRRVEVVVSDDKGNLRPRA
jgi:outer membrane protein OmpA-like peptidoglycan-associated protein